MEHLKKHLINTGGAELHGIKMTLISTLKSINSQAQDEQFIRH